jgi:hypothetical protein
MTHSMSPAMKRLTEQQLRKERSERKAKLAARRRMWAYEDAKRGTGRKTYGTARYVKRPTVRNLSAHFATVGLVAIVTILYVFLGTN